MTSRYQLYRVKASFRFPKPISLFSCVTHSLITDSKKEESSFICTGQKNQNVFNCPAWGPRDKVSSLFPAQDQCLTDLKLRCSGFLFNPSEKMIRDEFLTPFWKLISYIPTTTALFSDSVGTFYRNFYPHYQFSLGFSLLRCFPFEAE